MGWGSTLAIAIASSIAGMGACGYLGYLCVEWALVASRDTRNGYYIFIGGCLGMAAGLVPGAATARLVSSGFWNALGYSLAVVLGAGVLAGLGVRMYADPPPMLDGQRLMLEVELKSPQGWQPDNKARHGMGSFCWLDAPGSHSKTGLQISGEVKWNKAGDAGGQWVTPCVVNLFSRRDERYVQVKIGNKADVRFRVPLPGSPRSEDQQWSDWKPVDAFVFRCRIVRLVDFKGGQDVEGERRATEERDQALNAIPADAPVARWLGFFEDADARPVLWRRWDPAEQRALDAVKGHSVDLGPLLQSADIQIVRRAVYALAEMGETPDSLIAPLAKAGLRTIDLIEEARSGGLPDDPDLDAEQRANDFFGQWITAMRRASEATAFQPVLEQIEHAAADFPVIANLARTAKKGPSK